MVKRCCAKNCYNSQMTHKIAYFGFPKNEVVARKWAELSGREDLMQKKLDNVTKYYLCSDHFSRDSFLNPDVEDKCFLRLNRVPNIPIPTIFEDNLMKNVKSVTENPEKFVYYTRSSLDTLVIKREPKKVEVPMKVKKEVLPEPQLELKQESEEIVTEQEEIYEESTEYIEDYIYDEVLDISRTNEAESINIRDYCRLCARNIENLVPIFDENGEFSEETDCLGVMPTGLIQMNDNLPQSACYDCLTKLQACANVIEGFVLNQSLFVSE